MPLPTMTPEQRQDAQRKSLQARKARSEMLDAVKHGRETVENVLARGKQDPVAGKTRVKALVKALPKIGEAKAVQILTEADIPEDKKVQGLGPRQREALLDQVAA